WAQIETERDDAETLGWCNPVLNRQLFDEALRQCDEMVGGARQASLDSQECARLGSAEVTAKVMTVVGVYDDANAAQKGDCAADCARLRLVCVHHVRPYTTHDAPQVDRGCDVANGPELSTERRNHDLIDVMLSDEVAHVGLHGFDRAWNQ